MDFLKFLLLLLPYFQVQSATAAGNMEKERETLLELKNRTSPSSPGLEETLPGSPGSALSKVVVNGGESPRKS